MQYARKLALFSLRLATVGLQQRKQMANAEFVRGVEHRRRVVDQQRARRIEGVRCAQAPPKFSVLFRMREIVRANDAVKPALDAGVRHFDVETFAMRVTRASMPMEDARRQNRRPPGFKTRHMPCRMEAK